MRLVATLLLFALVGSSSVPARADGPPADDSPETFAGAVRALRDGRPGDAVAAFESLADRGLVDPVASYDRGLAYATRVRIGAEQPGDLGNAAQAFEEARALTQDARLADDASRALTVVRGEIARRRLRAGQSVEMVDAGRSLGRALAGLLREDVWTWICAFASAALAAGLFARWLAKEHRVRVAGGVSAAVASPVLALALAMTLAARHDRLNLREAVVVTSAARPLDDRGVALPGRPALPEGARVELVDARGGSVRVRFGAGDVWVAQNAVREIARP